MLIVAVITVPLLLTYDNDLSFNTVDEIDKSKESVMRINAISEAFGKGDSLPIQVLLKKQARLSMKLTSPISKQSAGISRRLTA